MSKAWIILKDWWHVILGAIGVFFLWLRFFHDSQVRKDANLEFRKQTLEERRKKLERAAANTEKEEARLEAKAKDIKERLGKVRPADDARIAANRLAKRFGWRTDEGT